MTSTRRSCTPIFGSSLKTVHAVLPAQSSARSDRGLRHKIPIWWKSFKARVLISGYGNFICGQLSEIGLDVEQLEAPDFQCRAPGIDFTVEATTVAPSTTGPLADHPNPTTQEEINLFLRDYMPIKFGSALSSKLRRTNKYGLHYWEREESKGKAIPLAIADYHKPAADGAFGSMTHPIGAVAISVRTKSSLDIRCKWQTNRHSREGRAT